MDGAKPYPYHSWTGVTGPQDSSQASEQVQDAEENLDAQQQQQLQQALQQQQQQQGRKLMQGPATQAKINEIAAINSGTLSINKAVSDICNKGLYLLPKKAFGFGLI